MIQRATLIDGAYIMAAVVIPPAWWVGWIEGVGVALGVALSIAVGTIRLRIALMDLAERRRQMDKRMKRK